MLSAQLGLPESGLTLCQSLPEDTPNGAGSYASRTTIQAGTALQDAGQVLVRRLIAAEAARLGLPVQDLRADAQTIRDSAGNILCTLAAALARATTADGARVCPAWVPVR